MTPDNALSIIQNIQMPKGTTKYLLVVLTDHNKCRVANIMDLSTGNVLTNTVWKASGKLVQHLSINPKRVSRLLKLATSLTK